MKKVLFYLMFLAIYGSVFVLSSNEKIEKVELIREVKLEKIVFRQLLDTDCITNTVVLDGEECKLLRNRDFAYRTQKELVEGEKYFLFRIEMHGRAGLEKDLVLSSKREINLVYLYREMALIFFVIMLAAGFMIYLSE